MSIESDAIGAIEALKSETLKRAFASVEADIAAEWRNSGLADTETREQLWLQLTALEAVRRKLQSFVDSAKIKQEI